MIAGLRLWLRLSNGFDHLPEADIATSAGAFAPLSKRETNRLCVQLVGMA
ncbi:hypothetical protein [Paracoccus sp. PAR01]|jgi:hypothetical protein|nr:hypothetical protein [Paracoccus sp. PAR01]MBD9529935.1 hypothetical protein [Paracoccus sp. PAR01]